VLRQPCPALRSTSSPPKYAILDEAGFDLNYSTRAHVDLISDALPFGRLWYGEPNAISTAIGYAKFRSRSHRAVIRVYDSAGNVIETHEHTGDFKKP
jgi:hypothetical protein